jgi:hypothetical protein
MLINTERGLLEGGGWSIASRECGGGGRCMGKVASLFNSWRQQRRDWPNNYEVGVGLVGVMYGWSTLTVSGTK